VKVVVSESRRTKNEPLSAGRHTTRIAIRNLPLNRNIDVADGLAWEALFMDMDNIAFSISGQEVRFG